MPPAGGAGGAPEPRALPWGAGAPLLPELFQSNPDTHEFDVSREKLESALQEWWVLPPSAVPCLVPAPAQAPLASWQEYYAARGLDSDFPAALLMDAALTAAAAVAAQRERAAVQHGAPPLPVEPLTVFLLGESCEGDMCSSSNDKT